MRAVEVRVRKTIHKEVTVHVNQLIRFITRLFSIMTYNTIMTYTYNGRCQGKSRFLYQPPCNLSTPAYSVAKRRQRLWLTISLLINTTNAGNEKIVKRHTV